MDSKKFELNLADLKKIGKGAFIALGGALLTYISSIITQTNFGEWTPIVVGFWSVVVNTAQKYFAGQNANETTTGIGTNNNQ